MKAREHHAKPSGATSNDNDPVQSTGSLSSDRGQQLPTGYFLGAKPFCRNDSTSSSFSAKIWN